MIVADLFARLGLKSDKASFDKGKDLIEGIHSALEAYLGYEGIKKIGELVEGTVQAAVAAKHMSEQLGISTDAVQELGYAADATGISADVMNAGLRKLGRGLEQAKKGTGPLVSGLHALHVPIANLRKEDLSQNLEEIADGFKNASPHVNKLAQSIAIFGPLAGPRLLPLLNRGAEGIKELREEAQKLGVVIDEDGIDKAEEFEESQKKLGATLKGLRNDAVIALMPALQEMADGLMEWVHANRDAIETGLEKALAIITTAFKLVGEAISWVTDLIKDHQDIFIAALAGIGLAITAFAVQAAIDWVIAFAPFVLIAALITGLMLGLKKLTEYVLGMSVTWGDMWDGVVESGKAVLEWFEDLPDTVTTWVQEVADAIKKAFADAWDSVVKGAHDAWEKIKDTPIIGHIIKGATAIGEGIGHAAGYIASGGGSKLDAIDNVYDAPAGPGAGGNNISVQGGDIGIKIDARGMDPDGLAATIQDAITAQQKDMLRQAHSSMAGGKR